MEGSVCTARNEKGLQREKKIGDLVSEVIRGADSRYKEWEQVMSNAYKMS